MHNGCHLRHSATEWPFVRPDARKLPFHARVVKAKVVLHRKIHGFEPTPDQKWQLCEQKYADLPLKQISALATLAQNACL